MNEARRSVINTFVCSLVLVASLFCTVNFGLKHYCDLQSQLITTKCEVLHYTNISDIVDGVCYSDTVDWRDVEQAYPCYGVVFSIGYSVDAGANTTYYDLYTKTMMYNKISHPHEQGLAITMQHHPIGTFDECYVDPITIRSREAIDQYHWKVRAETRYRRYTLEVVGYSILTAILASPLFGCISGMIVGLLVRCLHSHPSPTASV